MMLSAIVAGLARLFRASTSAAAESKRVRPQLERLETRDAPAIAVWTWYTPRYGDRVDALIKQMAPGTRDPVVFFRNLNGWLATSIAPRVPVFTNVNVY